MSEVAPATAEQTGKKLSLASKSKHTGQGFGHGGFAELLSATTMPLGDDKPLEAKKTKKIDDGVDDAACEKTCDHGKKDKHDEPRSLKKIDTSVMAMDGVDENIAAEGAHDAIVLDVEAVEEATAHLEKMVAELDPDDAEFLAHHLSLAAATDPLKKETLSADMKVADLSGTLKPAADITPVQSPDVDAEADGLPLVVPVGGKEISDKAETRKNDLAAPAAPSLVVGGMSKETENKPLDAHTHKNKGEKMGQALTKNFADEPRAALEHASGELTRTELRLERTKAEMAAPVPVEQSPHKNNIQPLPNHFTSMWYGGVGAQNAQSSNQASPRAAATVTSISAYQASEGLRTLTHLGQSISKMKMPDAPPKPVPEQFASLLVRKMKEGVNQFTLQLRPDELGKVEVKLTFDKGHVEAKVLVDQAATLDLLKADTKHLERILNAQSADGGTLSFQLRGEDQQAQGREAFGQKAETADDDAQTSDDTVMEEIDIPIIEAHRVNLRV